MRAVVPAALGGVSNAGKYLIAAAWRAIGQRFALARAGRHGAVCRVVVGCRVKGRIGFAFATLAYTCGTWTELAAPITSDHDREHGVVDVGISVAVVDHWRKTRALAALAFFCRRLISIDTDRWLKETAVPTRRFGLIWNTAIHQFLQRALTCTRGCGHTRACLMN